MNVLHNNLDVAVTTTHEILLRRMRQAALAMPGRSSPRDHYKPTDTFLASTSRHFAAVNAVLIPAVRREFDDGDARAKAFVHQFRMLELALNQAKAKLYGEAHAIHRSWAEVWGDVETTLVTTIELERELVAGLSSALELPRLDDLASRVFHAESTGPTRPHPYSPHLGLSGKVARQVLTRIDHFWDDTEGRMLPEPVRAHGQTHESLLAQYILGDPQWDLDEPSA
jgi:hypothetical protein